MRRWALYILLLLACGGMAFCASSDLIKPLPLKLDYDEKKALLGKQLYNDPALSGDGTVSCASCHILDAGGDDNLKFSFGIKGREGEINAPTVLNARYNFSQFWDGRAKDLPEQAMGPVENPVEMGNNFTTLVKTLKNQKPYRDLFGKIYPNGITKENIVDAIAEFEKALVTPNAPFDRYLRGDDNAISDLQKEGYELFQRKGCIACHNGVNVGGNLYQRFGIFEHYESKNKGRYNVTGKEEDLHYFKVPTLRNITLTSPYFHDGSVEKLEDAVRKMAQHQLGRKLQDDEVGKIVLFLESLTGDTPTILKE